MDKYKCVESFSLPRYDDDERMTEEYGEVAKDSIWEYENGYTGNSDVRMYTENGDDDFGYIDITSEHLKKYFSRIA